MQLCQKVRAMTAKIVPACSVSSRPPGRESTVVSYNEYQIVVSD